MFNLITGYWRRKWDRTSEVGRALSWRNLVSAMLLRPWLFYNPYDRLDESEKRFAFLNIRVFWLPWIFFIAVILISGSFLLKWDRETLEKMLEQSAELGPFWQTILFGLTFAAVAVIFIPITLPAFFLMIFLWMSLRQGAMKWASILLRHPIPMRDCGVLSFFSGLPLVGVLAVASFEPGPGRGYLLVLELWSLFLLISGVGAWMKSRWKRLTLFFFMAVFDTLVVYGISKILWWGTTLSR